MSLLTDKQILVGDSLVCVGHSAKPKTERKLQDRMVPCSSGKRKEHPWPDGTYIRCHRQRTTQHCRRAEKVILFAFHEFMLIYTNTHTHLCIYIIKYFPRWRLLGFQVDS